MTTITKKKKKRRIRYGALITLVLIVVAFITLICMLIFGFNAKFIGKKSVNADAAKYKEKHCLVFYPDGDIGKSVAKGICDTAEKDAIFDYSLVPYGDYYLVDYGNGTNYFVDKSYNAIKINGVSEDGKTILSDYLRYTMKKDYADRYYDSEFLEKSYVDNINLDTIDYDIDGQNVVCHFNDFDVDVLIPLKYMQSEINMNFGYENEMYVKPKYIDPNRPMVALTFDDGPKYNGEKPTSTERIIDVLHKYDSNGTFFVLGDNIWPDGEYCMNILRKSISYGNEYGSHTQSHPNLTNLSYDQIRNEIMIPANDLYNAFGYVMSIYRPPGGAINEAVKEAEPYPAIIWSIDTRDWATHDPSSIKDIVYTSIADNDVILFHDIYQDTANSIDEIVPTLIDRGYQLITVSELMNAMGVDKSETKVFYGGY